MSARPPNGADPLALLRDYKAGGQKLALVARLSGDVKSAFPDGQPKTASADGKAADKQSTSGGKADGIQSGKINAIVVADTDMLADQFWVDRSMLGQDMVVPTAHNGAFVVGALENLSGSNALIALRGRGVKDRPFTLVEDLRRAAEKKFRAKEQALEDKLKSVQAELQKIEDAGNGAGSSIVLSDKEQQAAEQFRSEMLETRRELREVKRALRQDIDDLDGWLKFANIALVPLMLGGAALGMSWQRSRRRSEPPKSES